MKTKFTIFLLMLIAMGLKGQQTIGDVYVINPSNGDENLAQVELRYQSNPKALYLAVNENNPLESITGYLSDNPCTILHLYIPASSESLIFSGFSLTSGNINEYRDFFVQWNEKISGKIIIHSLSLYQTGSTPDLIKKLSSLTGVPIEIASSY